MSYINHYLLLGDSNLMHYDQPITSNVDGLIHQVAISGMMMRKAQDYYKEIVITYPCKGIICMLGSNDWWTAENFGDNAGDFYYQYIELIMLRPEIPWYIICPPPAKDPEKDYGGGNLATYRCMCKIAAEMSGNIAIDSWNHVKPYPEDHLDWIHLTRNSRNRLMDAVKNRLT